MTIETRFERLENPISWDRNRDVPGLAMPQIATQKSVRWHLPLRKALKTQLRRGVRVAEGARLESVFSRNRDVGSNPTLSARLMAFNRLQLFLVSEIGN